MRTSNEMTEMPLLTNDSSGKHVGTDVYDQMNKWTDTDEINFALALTSLILSAHRHKQKI